MLQYCINMGRALSGPIIQYTGCDTCMGASFGEARQATVFDWLGEDMPEDSFF
jgi:hypothetical protein